MLRVLGPRADGLAADRRRPRARLYEVDGGSAGQRPGRACAWRARSLRGRAPRELPPEGMVRGAVQVPPDGRPVIFLADHPVTGGYPVVAVLTASACDRAARCARATPCAWSRHLRTRATSLAARSPDPTAPLRKPK